MSSLIPDVHHADDLAALKKLTATVYLCQILSFAMAGLPLLLGVAINFIYRNNVADTWLESHFNWQIKTAWITMAGFALSGFILMVNIQGSLIVLIPTLLLLIYRVVIGWATFSDDKAINKDIR